MRHEESTNVILHKVRPEVECILSGRNRAAGVCLSLLQAQDLAAQAAKRFLGSRAAPPLLSAVVTAGVYGCCAPLAYIERGGHTAYGGECMTALTAGILVWQAAAQWGRGR